MKDKGETMMYNTTLGSTAQDEQSHAHRQPGLQFVAVMGARESGNQPPEPEQAVDCSLKISVET
jgi:hypothetical protein